MSPLALALAFSKWIGLLTLIGWALYGLGEIAGRIIHEIRRSR
jgi:hypothetical protein